MKKYIQFSLILLTAFSLFNCTDEFLNRKPWEGLSDEAFWKSKGDLEGAVNSIYMPLVKSDFVGGDFEMLASVTTGDVHTEDIQAAQDLEALKFTTTNQFITVIWTSSYQGISRANMVLNRAPEMEIDTTFKKKKVAEAKFLRAFYYLKLVRAFGDVPLILTEQTQNSNTNVPRTPKADVLAQMEKDFADAAMDLPDIWDDPNKGRATQGAAYSFLALTNLYQQKWDEAIKNSEAVIGLSIYTLLPNFADVVKLGKENNDESLFETQFRVMPNSARFANQSGTCLPQSVAPRGLGDQYAIWGGWSIYMPTQKLIDSFEPGDKRRAAQILLFGETYTLKDGLTYTPGKLSTSTNPCFIKYWHAPLAEGNLMSPIHQPLMKYSMVLLNYAEALARKGRFADAYTQINKVRLRAGLSGKSGSDEMQCIKDINTERRHENILEQSFWWDLTRTGMAASFLLDEYGKTLPEYKYIFPIPQYELDNNTAIVQNPGYN